MSQVDQIQRQVELVAVSVGSRVRRLHDAMDSLAFVTREILRDDVSTAEVEAWFGAQGFEALPSGFYERAAHTRRAAETEGGLVGDFCYAWGAAGSTDPASRARAYALRRVMPHAAALQQRFKGVAWTYFQDGRNKYLTAVTPGLAPDSIIPADFDWHAYHSFTIAEPGVNPTREVRWSPPNIDYGGKGLISCVSIPVYEGDEFLGIWTMDVPLAELHADLTLESLGRIGDRQVNFVADYDGRLLAHPNLGPEAQGEKGAVYSVQLSSLGGDFATLDVSELAALGHGKREVVDAKGERLLLVFRAVPEIRWVIFTAFPAADLVEATQAAFQSAFAHLGAGDLTFRLGAVGDEAMQRLVSSFNEMTETLAESLRRRELAEAERQRLAAERQRMSRELEIAASIQLAMLPQRPSHPGFEFAGLMRPADEVGGDFYDVISRDDGLWVTIGDVSSHGLGAGLVMMLAQMAFRAVFAGAPALPADEVVRRVNRLVHANSSGKLGGGRYITGQLLAWRGGGSFDLAGGHLWPVVVDTARGTARQIEAPGPWIGIVPELPAVPVTRLELSPSEVLCLYSDGIIEAKGADGEMYDLPRLVRRVTEMLGADRTLRECAEAIHADVEGFSSVRDDDRTVLLLRRRAGAEA